MKSAPFNLFRALRLIALRDVISEPPEYHLRYIFRWFSKTFHVPLPEVENLPINDVLQAFYESRYEDMTEEDREAERLLLIETDEQKQDRLREADIDRLNYHEMREMAKAIAAEQAAKPPTGGPLINPLAPPTDAGFGLPEPSLDPPPVVPGLKPPPNIKMKFATQEEFEKRLEEEGLGLDGVDDNLPLKPST